MIPPIHYPASISINAFSDVQKVYEQIVISTSLLPADHYISYIFISGDLYRVVKIEIRGDTTTLTLSDQ